MNRRDFIAGLGGAVAWPLAASAQQAERVRRIGVLSGLTADDPQAQAELAAFREGLARWGWIVSRNLQFEDRFAAGDERRIHAFAEELVGKVPDVILARGTQATEILKQQTSTIPIVFVPGKYPPAKPGALLSEPLEAAGKGRWRDPCNSGEFTEQFQRPRLLPRLNLSICSTCG